MKISTLLLLAAPGTLAAQYNPLNYGAFEDFLIPKPVLAARSPVEARSALEARATYNSSVTGVVVDQLYIIGNATVSLTDAINNFGLATIFSLQASSLGLVATINNAASTVSAASGSITEGADLVAITLTVQSLAAVTNTSVTAAISQKETFGGVSPVVLASFQQLYNATQGLTDAINVKLGKLSAASAPVVAPIYASLQSGIEVFQKPNVNPSSVYAATSMSGAATTLVSRVAVGFGLAVFSVAYLYL